MDEERIRQIAKEEAQKGLGAIEIERYHGIIVAVGGIKTKDPGLPDWALSYVEYPPGQMPQYRDALMKEHVKIRQVTGQRIYFEE